MYVVLTIPIGLLWNVRIHTKQKVGIGVFLCLRVVMVVVAIIRTTGVHTSVGGLDLVWQIFWLQVEACTAVIMVSVTAFRSFLISKKPRSDRIDVRSSIRHRIRSWLSLHKSSAAGVERLSPLDQNRSPPQLTLGSRFRSIQHLGLFSSHTQPTFQSDTFSCSTHRTRSLEAAPNSSEILEICSDDPTSSRIMNDGRSHKQWLGKKPASLDNLPGWRIEPHRHWWQNGVISSYTPSNFSGNNNEIR